METLIIYAAGLYPGLALHYLKKLAQERISGSLKTQGSAMSHAKIYWTAHWPESLFAMISSHAAVVYMWFGDEPVDPQSAFVNALIAGYMADSIANTLSRRGQGGFLNVPDAP